MQSPDVTQPLALSPLVTDPVATPIFTVQLLGFSDREHTLFGSVFNLSRSRPMRYVEFDAQAHPHADFYIVDTNVKEALDNFVAINSQTYGGALFVGETALSTDHPFIKRPIRWAEVLLRLDELPRPAHPAQVAALIAAGLVELEQVPSTREGLDVIVVADTRPPQPPVVVAEPAPVTQAPSAPVAPAPPVVAEAPAVHEPAPLPGTETMVRVSAENDLEISTITSWYDRDEVITFRTDPAVLVIDPDIAARRYMAAKFIDLKYRVDYAENGEQALEMINTHRYNAVFLETALPGIDGYDVCKAIKGRPDRRRIAVIFVSNRNSTFDRVKGAMAGCDAFLAKPIDQDKLVATLDKFLPNWRLQLPIV